jgi:hypothetical protein
MFTLLDGQNPEQLFLKHALMMFGLEMVFDEERKWRVEGQQQQSADTVETKCVEVQDRYSESIGIFRQLLDTETLKLVAGLCGIRMYWVHYVPSLENGPQRGWITPVSAALYAQVRMEEMKLVILHEYWRLTKNL